LLLLTLTLRFLQLLHHTGLLNLLIGSLLIHLLTSHQPRPNSLSDIRASPTRPTCLQQTSSQTQQTLLPCLLSHVLITQQTKHLILWEQAIKDSVH
jgi:hypothetical protein